jgi:tetratricopeptide (TPR) repeat protein
VNYSHLRQNYLNNVLGKNHPLYPVLEIASRCRVLKIGDNELETPNQAVNPDWMRWNNLGIAPLDQFQCAESVAAFSEVIKLRHDYVDGYTNIGLTEILWEKYGSARTAIRRALTLDANNARALCYDGLLQRHAGNTADQHHDGQRGIRDVGGRSENACRSRG